MTAEFGPRSALTAFEHVNAITTQTILALMGLALLVEENDTLHR